MALLASRYVQAAIGLLAVVAALWGFGAWRHHQGYERGVRDTELKAHLQTIAIEQGMQYERDRADADYRGADGIGILISCVGEYESMGNEAARLAHKVAGLQGYVRSISPR